MKELQCSVRKHSRKQLEMKLLYPLEKSGKTRFTMDCYFFFPARLHVTEKRIGLHGVLNNMQIYTRFSSPLIPLEKVIDTDFDLSPLVRIENLLDSLGDQSREIKNNLLYELQTLSNLYRAETRNFVELMKREIRRDNPSRIYRERILHMLVTARAFLGRFRELHPRFLDPHVDETLRTALRWADESISIITEKQYIRLYGYCNPEKDREIMNLIEELTESETKYRKSMNYLYLYRKKDSHSGETMAYRESMLKRWSQSAMYMNSEFSRTPGRIGQIIAGTAAGLAMFFAVFAAIIAENYTPRNSSLWILVMVISYIMKDRIKEMLRGIFGNLMPGLTTDQQINLYDPAMKTRVGRSSGIIRFTTPDKLSRELREIRFKSHNPFREIMPPNDVIHYRKIMKVRSETLLKNHTRLESLTEIIRFQIDSWLKHMDDPQETLYRLENGKKELIQGSRVYRVHLIVKLDEEYFNYLLVLNNSGIVRIESC